ncbi:MAG: NADH-quinone oxidoreductase subunit H [Acidobacteriota bacterium]
MFRGPGVAIEIAQSLLALMLAPALVGLVRWIKARLQSRQGAPVWMPYAQLRRLFRKQVVVSPHASWVFHVAPFVVFGATLVVSLLVPIAVTPLPFNDVADLFTLVYLLMLATVFLALGGLDPGSAFGGMGSSREMTIAALSEPAVALAILSLAMVSGSTNLGEIAARTVADPAAALSPGYALAFVSLFIVMLAETGRLPVDNPSTHLELTMIHEAMVLEYSGPYLALLEWASWLKFFVFCVLASNLFVPWGLSTSLEPGALAVALATTLIKLVVLAAAVAVLETRVAKLRLFRVPELLAVSFVLGLLAAASSFALR